MQLNENMEKLRKTKNESQNAIAELLNTTQQQYWKYENGKQELPIRHLLTLAKHYNVTTDELLGIKELSRTLKKEDYYIIEIYNQLSEKKKGKAERYIEELLEQQKDE